MRTGRTSAGRGIDPYLIAFHGLCHSLVRHTGFFITNLQFSNQEHPSRA
jgi:hypothetical protein